MPVAVVLEFSGATLDQYDQMVEKMGLTPGGPGAPGGISHWVTATDDGFRVTDVWTDRETFEKFAQEKIGPIAAEVGVTAQPNITFYEVHSHLTPA